MVLSALTSFSLSAPGVIGSAFVAGWLVYTFRAWRGLWWPLIFRLLWWLATKPGSQPGYFFRLVGWLTSPRPSRRLRKKYVSLHQYVRRLKAQLLWQISPWNPANLPLTLCTLLRHFFSRPLTVAQQELAYREAAAQWQASLARFRALHAAGRCSCWRCRFL